MVPNAIHWVRMPRATAIRQEKVIDEDGNILEVVIWRVPATSRSPVGVRYRLAFIRKGEARPVVLYDNHAPKDTTGILGELRKCMHLSTSTSCSPISSKTFGA